MIIISELGVDLKTFLTAAALTGWAGLRPRNDESAGKIKSKKNCKRKQIPAPHISAMCLGGITTKNGWLKTKYEQLCARKSSKKALIAISRKLLVIIWHVLSKQEPYKEFVPEIDPKQKQKKINYHKKIIEQLQAE